MCRASPHWIDTTCSGLNPGGRPYSAPAGFTIKAMNSRRSGQTKPFGMFESASIGVLFKRFEALGHAGYPAEPLVSYRVNRQLSGWILAPLMIRAFRAYC